MKPYRKHHPYKKMCACILALLVLLLAPTAFAATKLSMEADKAAVQAGDKIEVLISVQGSGMAIAEGSFTYDPTLLTYVESEGGASDGFLNLVSAQKGGADVLRARIVFTAAAAGNAEIKASIERVVGYDGTESEGATASISLSVSAPAPTPAPTPLNYAATGVAAQNTAGSQEQLYIWRSLENTTIPSRYTETTLIYHGETVAAAKVEESDAPVLLYLSNAAGDTGGYYIFDEAADTLYPYQTVSSVSKSYILLSPDGSVAVPEGFAETTLTINEKEVKAWKSQDAQGELYLIYARNPSGEAGFFLYNIEDESLQRYAVMPARPPQPSLPPESPSLTEPQPADAPEKAQAPETSGEIVLSKAVALVLFGSVVLLLLAVVGLLLLRAREKARRKRRAAQRRAERERALQQGAEQ